MTDISRPAGRIWFLQFMRSLAVIFVLMDHMLGGFWYGHGEESARLAHLDELADSGDNPYQHLVAFFIDRHFMISNVGVAFFFLISGILIPIALDRYSPGRFVVTRIFRIYPVWIVSLAIVAAFFAINSALNDDFTFVYSVNTWIANFFLLQDWSATPYVNPVSWTLLIEIKFYLLCALLAYAGMLRRAEVIVGLVAILAAMSISIDSIVGFVFGAPSRPVIAFAYVSSQAVPFLCVTFAGVCSYNLLHGYWPMRKTAGAIAAIAACFTISVLFGLTPRDWAIRDIVSFGIAGLAFLILFSFRDRIPHVRVFDWIANISYPIYVTHYVIGGAIALLTYRVTGSQIAGLAVSLGVVLALSEMLHRFVEDPANAFGKRVGAQMRHGRHRRPVTLVP